MLRIRDHETLDLFDRWAYLGPKRRRLLERSWAGVFRQHLLSELPVERLGTFFSGETGRPTKDLHVAIGALILQQLHDLTDAQAVEALALNIAWHYALDLRSESDAYLCERTLRNYRRRVMDEGLDEVLFQRLTDRLLRVFEIETRRQRLDSTALRSYMRNLTRLGVVVESIAKFLRELARRCPALAGDQEDHWHRRYVARLGDGGFANTRPTESKRRLPEAGADLAALARRFRDTEAADLASFQILERVLSEQFEESTTGAAPRVREPKEIPCDNVRNPADPDSSYNARRGQGYMAQVMETYEEHGEEEPGSCMPDLITHVRVHKMTHHDGRQLEHALRDVTQRQARPEILLADTHYGSTENVASATEQGVELISPAMPAKGSKSGRLTLEQFALAEDGTVARCPAGHAPLSVSLSKSRLEASFDPSICSSCPDQAQCPSQTTRHRGARSRLQYTPERIPQRARRLAEQQDRFRERYRWRAGVEATMSRLKHQMGLASLRVRGMKSVRYTTFLRALCLNLQRCTVSRLSCPEPFEVAL